MTSEYGPVLLITMLSIVLHAIELICLFNVNDRVRRMEDTHFWQNYSDMLEGTDEDMEKHNGI